MNLQDKVNYLISKAKDFESYFRDESELYEAVNNLDRNRVQDLLEGFDLKEKDAQAYILGPVNIVRSKLLKFLLEGKKVDGELINEIKDKFILKDLNYFADYPEHIKKVIQDYTIGDLGPFHAWRNDFRILYTFFFSLDIKLKVNQYLEDIKSEIFKAIDLSDFTSHLVNFDGIQNFGSTRSWMAFFPKDKVSHTNAYQLFLSIQHDGLHYGLVTGSVLKRRVRGKADLDIEDLETSMSIADVIVGYKNLKDEVIKLNKSIKQIWKFAPGENAKYWDDFSNEGIMAIGWDQIDDLSKYPSIDDISNALGVSTSSNQSWNIDLFRNASVGDIVIANRGKREAVGVGIITGKYQYAGERKSYLHIRSVNWLIKKDVKFDKTIFRPDTFSPTIKYPIIRETYLHKYPELATIFQKLDEGIVTDIDIEATDEKAYYWLNANAKIWNYKDFNVGETQAYTSKNSKGNKRRVYKHFLDVNPGDVMIGYLTSPYRQIVALLEVTKSIFESDLEGEVIEFKITEFLENPVDFDTLKSNPDLKNAEPIINIQGSLFKLSEEEFETIQNIIEDFNPKIIKEVEEYTIDEAIEESGMLKDQFEEILMILKEKKQLIIQGAPGTGKTYIAEIIAKYLAQDDDKIEIIQFHPSYSYEDFVEGYRPSDTGGLSLKGGIFKEICHKATINPKDEYVLIIDEINRGDISKIFGELLYLLEYRDHKIKLTYTPEIDFEIPENLYLIGTMNLADRSLAMIDYALRRRFSFITLFPEYKLIKKHNKGSSLDIDTVIENIKAINQKIASNPSLGKDFEIGHSYFLNKMKDLTSMKFVWRYEIEPLLSEYFFDNKEEVNNLKISFFKNVEN